jgi:hypothetical protein
VTSIRNSYLLNLRVYFFQFDISRQLQLSLEQRVTEISERNIVWTFSFDPYHAIIDWLIWSTVVYTTTLWYLKSQLHGLERSIVGNLVASVSFSSLFMFRWYHRAAGWPADRPDYNITGRIVFELTSATIRCDDNIKCLGRRHLTPAGERARSAAAYLISSVERIIAVSMNDAYYYYYYGTLQTGNAAIGFVIRCMLYVSNRRPFQIIW